VYRKIQLQSSKNVNFMLLLLGVFIISKLAIRNPGLKVWVVAYLIHFTKLLGALNKLKRLEIFISIFKKQSRQANKEKQSRQAKHNKQTKKRQKQNKHRKKTEKLKIKSMSFSFQLEFQNEEGSLQN
jgi:Sec-independent protein translocase protein TatA